MKVRKHTIRLVTLCVAFTAGAALVKYQNTNTAKVYAAQHIDNYNSYTYNGHYYDSINFNDEGGMNGELRTSLTSLIRPAGFYIYSSSGTTHLSTQLQYADEDPTNEKNMVLFYSRDSITKTAATVNSVVQWNREHVWCKNLSNNNWSKNNGAEDEAGTDILHLRPTYESINSSRSDVPFGDINKTNPKYFDPDTKKVTNDSSKMLYAYSNGTYFEPLDSLKGDVARIIMYVWTTYTGYVGLKEYKPLNILSIFQSYDTLLRWHTQDRPDALEGHRNDYAQSSRQANRNPFVDHPELAWRIFGDQASNEVKNACMQAYPYNVEQIDPTGISLNRNSASLDSGSTLQLTASLIPNNATASITWSSSDESVATVSNSGLVTAVNGGSATITARVSQSIYAICSITVTQAEYIKVASYDFSAGNTSNTSEYSVDELKARFNDSDVTGGGLSDIVTSVSSSSKVYAGYANYYDYGLKFGTSSAQGNFTVALNREVNRVIVKTAGWTASDTLKVGDAAVQTPGVAYNQANSIKTLTFDITSSDSVSFVYNKRGFIQSIDFYAPSGVVSPEHYINTATSYAKLTANETIESGEEATISKTILEVSGTTTDGTKVSELTLDSNITVSTNSNGNNGKVYSSGAQWRLYQSDNAVVTINASNGATISSVTFTYESNSGGILKYGNNKVTSGTPVSINSLSSVSFDVANSGSANNGQARVTAISVTYGNTTISVDSIKLHFGATISKANWDAINELEDHEITDYGIMMFRTVPERINSVYSVEQYYTNNPENVSIARKGNGLASDTDGVIDFSVIVNITRETSFRRIYCAAPFIVVNDHYYFLEEKRYSVNSLASEYLTNGGSSLSNRALQYLANTSPEEE